MKPAVLIIDDDVDICTLLQKFLIRNDYDVDISYSGKKILDKFKHKRYDLVLCDYRLEGLEGIDVLKEIKRTYPSTIVVIMTGYSDIKTAVNVIKLGAFDYITKPLIPSEVLNIIQKALEYFNNHGKNELLPIPPANTSKSHDSKETFLKGISPQILELYKQIDIVAPTNLSVILYGESGSGKEVIAKTIHEKSLRKKGPFIALDCGTLSRELANSELFGHVKGSFTGAYSDKKGHFELAHRGTLFLDEVANLSYEIQAALLRVIQERKMKKIGGTTEIDLDVRIILASNQNLCQAYKQGLFREDLYHRLDEFSINVPALKDRKEDIPLFANFFLKKANLELKKNISGIEDEVMDLFQQYSWPGNLREFRNMIRKAVLLTSSERITKDSLPPEIINLPHSFSSSELIGKKHLLNAVSESSNLKEASSEIEYQMIIKILKSVNFNKSEAAKVLNIDRKTLYNKLKQHNL